MTSLLHRGQRTASLLQRASTPSTLLRTLPSFSPTLRTSAPLSLSRYRYASTSPKSIQTTRNTLNPPTSTLPAPIEPPIRSTFVGQFALPKYLFHLGKAYATFYKTGVKNVYFNFRDAQPLQSLIDKKYQGSLSLAVSANALSRSDFQLLLRSWHDIKKVPLFGLLFLVCGEFTPLIVVFVSSIVPWTCRIPKQILSDRSTLENRRSISFRNLTLPPPPPTSSHPQLQRQQLLHISWSLGLSSKIWDYIGGSLPGPPDFMLRSRVAKRVEYLEMDDKLLLAGGKEIKKLEIEEVRMALVERGVDILQLADERLGAGLEAWLRSRGEGRSVESLLLTRPNVWPTTPKSLLEKGKSK